MSIVQVEKKTARYIEHAVVILDRLTTDVKEAFVRTLPHWNPDGTEVKTIAQAAAIMGLPEVVVAHHALEGGTDDLLLKVDARAIIQQKDRVASQEGARRYGKPIGSLIGDGEDDDKRRDPMNPKAYRLNNIEDARTLIRSWAVVPRGVRAALKKRLTEFLAANSDGDEQHRRLNTLVSGLGDGDGRAEPGEGVGRAFARGGREGADEWIAEHRKPKKTIPAKKASSSGKKSLEDLLVEVKVIRRVRTPAGVRKYKQPIGSIIVRDGADPLSNIRVALEDDYENGTTVLSLDGKKKWQVTQAEDDNRWYALDDATMDWNTAISADTEEDVLEALNASQAPKGSKKPAAKAPTKKPAEDKPKPAANLTKLKFGNLPDNDGRVKDAQRRGTIARNIATHPDMVSEDMLDTNLPRLTSDDLARLRNTLVDDHEKYSNRNQADRSEARAIPNLVSRIDAELAKRGHKGVSESSRAEQQYDAAREAAVRAAGQGKDPVRAAGAAVRATARSQNRAAAPAANTRKGKKHGEYQKGDRVVLMGSRNASKNGKVFTVVDVNSREVIVQDDRGNQSRARLADAPSLLAHEGSREAVAGSQADQDRITTAQNFKPGDAVEFEYRGTTRAGVLKQRRANGQVVIHVGDMRYTVNPVNANVRKVEDKPSGMKSSKDAKGIAKNAVRMGQEVDAFRFTRDVRDRLQAEYDQWVENSSSDELEELRAELERLSKSGGLTARDKASAKTALDALIRKMKR